MQDCIGIRDDSREGVHVSKLQRTTAHRVHTSRKRGVGRDLLWASLAVIAPIGAIGASLISVGAAAASVESTLHEEIDRSAEPRLRHATLVDAAGAPVAGAAMHAGVDCQPQWLPTVGGQPGANKSISALAVFDDGNGPALFVGGQFSAVGGVAASGIARWDGISWSEVDGGVGNATPASPSVSTLIVFDDGSGPALYAGGYFSSAGGVNASRFARWRPQEGWSPVIGATSGTIAASAVVTTIVFDDGSGPALYVGGKLSLAGSPPTKGIARWDGTEWSDVGGGVDGAQFYEVLAMEIFDDGDGPALCVGGKFTSAGGEAAMRIARWDGSTWTPLGAGVTGGSHPSVLALRAFDDGTGPALFVGGSFTTAGGVAASNVARWDGANWSTVGAGFDHAVRVLEILDSGTGPALHAGGSFSTSGASENRGVARWSVDQDDGAWTTVATNQFNQGSSVATLGAFDLGSGPAIFAGGEFTQIGDVAAMRLARLDGDVWAPIGDGIAGGTQVTVNAVAIFDDGEGPALFVGGAFTAVDGIAVNNVARWRPNEEGGSWSTLDGGTNGWVNTLTVHDDGDGPALFVGGEFTTVGTAGGTAGGGIEALRVARWRGDDLGWTTAGAGFSASVTALEVLDVGDGATLYAGGNFTMSGSAIVSRVARWNPTPAGGEWLPLSGGVNSAVRALAAFDDGNGGGPALYVGGAFSHADGMFVNRIARWNGAAWSPVGGGAANLVRALMVFDDGLGGGPALFAVGAFSTIGDIEALRIARWNGVAWAPVGEGLDGQANAMAVFDDGSGPVLHVGGKFTTAGGVAAGGLAKWDGISWSASGNSVDDWVNSFAELVDESTGAGTLFAVGAFTASTTGDSHLTRLEGCPVAPVCAPGDLDCDGVVDFDDLAALLASWGPCPGSVGCPGDLNGDGVVDGADLGILLANWTSGD